MSTRNVTCVIHRDYAQNNELGFAQDPSNVAEHSYVNMYLHHDGYPEWQGVQIANWLKANKEACGDGGKLTAKLVHDMHYDSCYLYPSPDDMDHQYTYVIWVGDSKDIWISCYDQYASKNVFVLKPEGVIKRYKSDMEYTKFDEGETRSNEISHFPSGYD